MSEREEQAIKLLSAIEDNVKVNHDTCDDCCYENWTYDECQLFQEELEKYDDPPALIRCNECVRIFGGIK